MCMCIERERERDAYHCLSNQHSRSFTSNCIASRLCMESTRFGDVSLPLTLAAKISDGNSLCKISSSRVWGTSGSAVCVHVDSHRLCHIYLRLMHSLQVYGFASIFTESRTQILANFLKILKNSTYIFFCKN